MKKMFKKMKSRHRLNNRRRTDVMDPITIESAGRPKERLKDGGFISWPDSTSDPAESPSYDGIRVGRNKDGGFIAFPA